MNRRLLPLVAFLTLTAVAAACNIPVFRYALERWQPDSCEIVVFHEGKLSEAQQSFIADLETASIEKDGSANVRIAQHDVRETLAEEGGSMLAGVKTQPEFSLPYLVVRSHIGQSEPVNNWHGSLNEAMTAGILNSPARTELSRRLLRGDSAVWMVLRSTDKKKNVAVVELLNKQLKELSEKIPLPEGIGLPGSELHSDIPLLMQFSVMEIDPEDPQEQFLVRLLHGLAPDAKEADDALVVPVFGRGRALEVIPASQVDAALIEDLTVFLSGACSCQVKNLNPGFDLLLSTAWNEELFGEDAVLPVKMTSVEADNELPVLIPIAPGRSGSRREPTQADSQVAEVGGTEPKPTKTEDTAGNESDSIPETVVESTQTGISPISTSPVGLTIMFLLGTVAFITLTHAFRS